MREVFDQVQILCVLLQTTHEVEDLFDLYPFLQYTVFLAEGTGFEPVRVLRLKGLATPRFGPLSQPSIRICDCITKFSAGGES